MSIHRRFALIALTLAASSTAHAQTDALLGQLAWVPYSDSAKEAVPKGWHLCDGAILNINTNTALFSLLGTTFGGNGVTTFALPDLRGRMMIGAGQGPGLSNRVLGQQGGAEKVVLNAYQLPAHAHTLYGSKQIGDSKDPTDGVLAVSSQRSPDGPVRGDELPYRADGDRGASLNGSSLGETGHTHAHENMKPYATLRCIIATQGLFPSRN